MGISKELAEMFDSLLDLAKAQQQTSKNLNDALSNLVQITRALTARIEKLEKAQEK